MNPEARFLRQATYTPIDTTLASEPENRNMSPRRPLLKPGILALALGSPERAKEVLHRLRKMPLAASFTQAPVLIRAAEAITKGDHLTAAVDLADVELADITRFAETALDIQISLVDEAGKNLGSAIDAAFTRASQSIRETDETAIQQSSWRANIETTLNKEGVASPAGILRRQAYAGPNIAVGDVLSPSEATSVPTARAASSATVTLSTAQVAAELAHRNISSFAILGGLRSLTLSGTEELSHQMWQAYSAPLVQKERDRIDRIRDLVRGLVQLFRVEPLGFLHLERLQFTPVGYRRGDLIYSVPLMPGEVIRLTHREWSKTETDLSKLVATSLETAAQDALSEKSELTESFKTQQQRDSAFSASTTVSDGTGPVHISATASYSAKNSDTQSRESAARRTREVTRVASSRAKSEHKITFRVSTQYEVEDQSYREIKNEKPVAVRWDFHRLMREWHVELFRYDVRLTYGLVIPEPGSYLMRRYVRLNQIEALLAQQNSFALSPAHITSGNYALLAQRYRVTLEPPPAEHCYATAYDQQTYSGDRTVGTGFLELSLPAGYGLEAASARGSAITMEHEPGKPLKYAAKLDPLLAENSSRVNGSARGMNQYLWEYNYDWSEELEPPKEAVLGIYVWGRGALTNQARREWQNRCYERLVEAAKAQFEERRERLTRMRDNLQAELARLDGLTLRKIEREELMKAVLRWLLGPGFSFYPSDLPPLTLSATADLEYFDPDTESVLQACYRPMLQHGEIVRFLHHAIEWENLNYILYPYFWTDDSRWDFKQALYHGDYEHWSFLRAGAARVVLTIRPGYEDAFLAFQETLRLDPNIEHPYTSVGNELKQIAQTVYHYTPGANEELPENRVDSWYEFTPTGALDVVEGSTLPE